MKDIEELLEQLTTEQLQEELARRGFKTVDPLEFTQKDFEEMFDS